MKLCLRRWTNYVQVEEELVEMQTVPIHRPPTALTALNPFSMDEVPNSGRGRVATVVPPSPRTPPTLAVTPKTENLLLKTLPNATTLSIQVTEWAREDSANTSDEDIPNGHFQHQTYGSLSSRSNDFLFDENASIVTGDFDFGIYLEYWRRDRKNSVIPKYETLKEELTSNRYARLTERQYIELLESCQRYLKLGYKAKDIGSSNEICGLPPGTAISIQHLIAMKVYTDFNETQKEFKRHCRRLHKGESIESVIHRNEEIAIWCRLLKESVMFYGKVMAKKEVVFCGLTARLVFRSLHQRFECPLSTTKSRTVAENFTDGITGVILRLKRANAKTKYLDTSPFSTFSSEEERLFMGSSLKIKLIIVFNQETNKWEPLKPRCFISALGMFEQIHHGHFADGNTETSLLLLSLIHLAMEESNTKGTVYLLTWRDFYLQVHIFSDLITQSSTEKR